MNGPEPERTHTQKTHIYTHKQHTHAAPPLLSKPCTSHHHRCLHNDRRSHHNCHSRHHCHMHRRRLSLWLLQVGGVDDREDRAVAVQQGGEVHGVALGLLRQAAHPAAGAIRIVHRGDSLRYGQAVACNLEGSGRPGARGHHSRGLQGGHTLTGLPPAALASANTRCSLKAPGSAYRRVKRWVSRRSSKAGMPQPSSAAFLPKLARLQGTWQEGRECDVRKPSSDKEPHRGKGRS